MKIVLIACAGGATSSLFCAKVKKAATKKGVNCDFISSMFFETPTSVLEQIEKHIKDGTELLLIYGGSYLVATTQMMDRIGEMIEIAYIAPQMHYMVDELRVGAKAYNIPVEKIPRQDFGMMRGEKLFDEINIRLKLNV